MLRRWHDARLTLPTVAALMVLSVMIGLGHWQWMRKAWKDELQRQIDARVAAAPVDYAAALRRASPGAPPDYQRVRLVGRFDHAAERHVFWAGPYGPGWLLLTPLVAEGGTTSVLVNRGWMPEREKDPALRPASQPAGLVTIIGLVRSNEQPGTFAPPSNAARNTFHVRNVDLLLPRTEPYLPPNFARDHYVDALESEPAPAEPRLAPRPGVATAMRLSNRHLEYAFTWWGLAATLVGVYLVFARGRIKALSVSDGSI